MKSTTLINLILIGLGILVGLSLFGCNTTEPQDVPNFDGTWGTRIQYYTNVGSDRILDIEFNINQSGKHLSGTVRYEDLTQGLYWSGEFETELKTFVAIRNREQQRVWIFQDMIDMGTNHLIVEFERGDDGVRTELLVGTIAEDRLPTMNVMIPRQ